MHKDDSSIRIDKNVLGCLSVEKFEEQGVPRSRNFYAFLSINIRRLHMVDVTFLTSQTHKFSME